MVKFHINFTKFQLQLASNVEYIHSTVPLVFFNTVRTID